MSRDGAGIGKDITEPKQWPLAEDDRRREPVLDHNFRPPRVVRLVGYRKCMCCRNSFWSGDVARVRICDYCKSFKSA